MREEKSTENEKKKNFIENIEENVEKAHTQHTGEWKKTEMKKSLTAGATAKHRKKYGGKCWYREK